MDKLTVVIWIWKRQGSTSNPDGSRLLIQWHFCVPSSIVQPNRVSRFTSSVDPTQEHQNLLQKNGGGAGGATTQIYRPGRLMYTSDPREEVLLFTSGRGEDPVDHAVRAVRTESRKAQLHTQRMSRVSARGCGHDSNTHIPCSNPHCFSHLSIAVYTVYSTCSPMRSRPTNKKEMPWNRRK